MIEQLVKDLVAFDVEAYVDEYEFRGDEGAYTPSQNEKALLIDAIHGVISELCLSVPKRAEEPQPVKTVGEHMDEALARISETKLD